MCVLPRVLHTSLQQLPAHFQELQRSTQLLLHLLSPQQAQAMAAAIANSPLLCGIGAQHPRAPHVGRRS